MRILYLFPLLSLPVFAEKPFVSHLKNLNEFFNHPAPLSHQDVSPKPDPLAMQEQKQIKQWLEDLEDDDIAKRDEATENLISHFKKAKTKIEALGKKTTDPEVRMRLAYILKHGPRDPRARGLGYRLSQSCLKTAPQIADDAFSADEETLQEVLLLNKGGEQWCNGPTNEGFEENDMTLIAQAVAANLRERQKDWTKLKDETKRLLLDNLREDWGRDAARESLKELRGLRDDPSVIIQKAAKAALNNAAD